MSAESEDSNDGGGYANQEFADEAHAELREQRTAREDELATHERTRRNLEGGLEPADDAPATAAEADIQGGFAMSIDRRAGSTFMTVEHADEEGETVETDIRFGKPSGRASMQILDPIQDMDEDAPLGDLAEFLWPTLASWSVKDDYDTDWWADQTTFGESMTTLRNLAFGGNDPTESGL